MRFDSIELWRGHHVYAFVVRKFFRPYRYLNMLLARGRRRREFMIVDEALWSRICDVKVEAR